MAKNNTISKRDLILDAAYKLILDKGYWDTKIIDIADAAGIGKGTIYEYFESKDAILYALYKTKIECCYQDLSNLISLDMNCEGKIREYVKFELTNTQRFGFSKNILMDMFMKSDAFQNRDLIEAIHKLIRYKISVLCQIIEDGMQNKEFQKIDSMMAATAIMGAVNSFITFDCCLVNPKMFMPMEKKQPWNFEELLSLIFQGIKQQKC